MNILQKISPRLLSILRVVNIVLVFVFVANMLILAVPRPTPAQAGPGLPFGGMVTAVQFCNCSNNFRLTVSGPVGGIFMYQFGSTIVYEYYRIPFTGVWLLGTYVAPISCLMFVGKGCSVVGVHPLIYMVGTSR